MLRRRRAQRIANYNNSFIPNQQAYPPQQGGYPSPGYPPHAGPGGGPEMPYPPPAFHPPSGPPPPPMYTPKA
ncbi:hypothetical protein BOTBODRAFT_30183 [Botryobasidium botryosum FD-172 SS1]|uniref:Uncharacterized protein n=1 Tax=Botryobasidium botryosum (strain FD-172 SS1) TaxID=930990 RepID=A0A067N0U8_BOTB1|nr:hypothetical protein BOTBODRAFT_30183 [Botryobasidium botryosum FD-172 SS1]